MMTKEQYIDYWTNTAEEDWITVEALMDGKRYLHGLFWAHLTLEKLAKAHWVKNHEENIPPKVHNIVWLLEESNVDLGNDKMIFLTEFNRYQLSTRYPDYVNKMYRLCTKEFTMQELEKVKEVRTCLLKML
jgi:HEPN domain-containing protein